MRRLPVYIVIDLSGSMHGESIEAVRNGMQMLVSTLRSDPYALETVHISVILCDDKARQVVPLTELMQFQPPNVEAGSTTTLGDALLFTKECIEREVRKPIAETKGDWRPLVFLMTDGLPTDDWEDALTEFKKAKPGKVIACAVGPQSDSSFLKRLTDAVVSLDTEDSSTIGAFFRWISPSISTSSKKIDQSKYDSTQIYEMPPPPPENKLVRSRISADIQMRRLPVYLLLDTSGSMHGEPIEAVNSGIRAMVGALRQDPHALETVHVGIVTFDSEAKVVAPLTPIEYLRIPEITTPRSGATHLGLGLEVLGDLAHREVRRSTPERKGDWAPYLFVMTDGKPSDTQAFAEQCPKIRAAGFAGIIGCVAGPKASKQDLTPLCDQVLALDTMDGAGFVGLFEWVTKVVSTGNRSVDATAKIDLPPPPSEIRIVL